MGPGRDGHGVAWVGDTLYLLDADTLDTQTLWRLTAGELSAWKSPTGGPCARLSASPDGRHLARFGDPLVVWDLATGHEVLTKPNAGLLPMRGDCVSADVLWVHGVAKGMLTELSVPSGDVLRTQPGPAADASHVMVQGHWLTASGWGARGRTLIDLRDETRPLAEDSAYGAEGLSHAGALTRDGTAIIEPMSTFVLRRLPLHAEGASRVRGPKSPVRGRCELAVSVPDAAFFAIQDTREGGYYIVHVPLVPYSPAP